MTNIIGYINIKAYIKVIVTVALIAAACVLIYKSFKYIRAFVKRSMLVAKLKKLCRENGYTMEKLSSYYKSVFTMTDGPEVLITTPDKKYCVKFFTCLRYKDTYTLADAEHYTTKSNVNMTLVDTKYPSSGLVNVGELWMPRIARFGAGVVNEVEVIDDGKDAKADEHPDAVKVLCMNPIPVEIRKVVKSTTEQVFDGDEVDGYTVYSGDGLCRALA